MLKNKAFRANLEPLEDRLVLSGSLGAVGALGDSYSDEYEFYSPDRSHARNWVEVLASAGKANFGAFTKASRGEPRDQGFANDWARSGATSAQMVSEQLPGLARQVASGRVKYVSVLVGGDDFLYDLEGAALNPPTAAEAATQLQGVAENLGANLETAVNTLLAVNPRVKVVVSTIPDVASLPIVRVFDTTTAAQSLVNATDAAIDAVNAQIRTLVATSTRVAVADLAAQSTVLTTYGTALPYGGTTIDLATPSDDYHSFFLADGIHVGTVGQGLIADAIVGAIDAKFGARVTPLSANQIVAYARLVQSRTRGLA